MRRAVLISTLSALLTTVAISLVLAGSSEPISLSLTTSVVSEERATQLAQKVRRATRNEAGDRSASRPFLSSVHRPGSPATVTRATPAPRPRPAATAPVTGHPAEQTPVTRQLPTARTAAGGQATGAADRTSALPVCPTPSPSTGDTPPATGATPPAQLPPQHPGLSRKLVEDADQALGGSGKDRAPNKTSPAPIK